MSKIKNITLRVEDDFHYSVKSFATKKGMTLQHYMISVVEEDLKKNHAYIKSPISEIVDQLSSEELLELMNKIKEKKDNSE